MKCSICFEEIPVLSNGWDGGNNAAPVNTGRCCDDCNLRTVVPARLARMRRSAGSWMKPEGKPEDDRD